MFEVEQLLSVLWYTYNARWYIGGALLITAAIIWGLKS